MAEAIKQLHQREKQAPCAQHVHEGKVELVYDCCWLAQYKNEIRQGDGRNSSRQERRWKGEKLSQNKEVTKA